LDCARRGRCARGRGHGWHSGRSFLQRSCTTWPGHPAGNRAGIDGHLSTRRTGTDAADVDVDLDLDVDVDVDAGAVLPSFGGGQDKTWVDPIVGAKFHYAFAERWGLHGYGYGDVGGFGVSSDLTYQLMGTISYSFNKHVMLQAGYRAFGVDFEDGSFQFDATLHGPIVALTFSF
jgi:hypothetical protein